MDVSEVIEALVALGAPLPREDAAGRVTSVRRVTAPQLHQLARRVGRNHDLAQQVWDIGTHEARELAPHLDEPNRVTEEQMERWVAAFDSWDVCDGCCCYLFDRVSWSYQKATEWTERDEEFVKRAGFALMAYLAVHDKKAADAVFLDWLPIIAREATDPRHFVKNATNWALRQIGKRNANLNAHAIEAARRIRAIDNSTARWVAADALRELRGEAVQRRLKRFSSSLHDSE